MMILLLWLAKCLDVLTSLVARAGSAAWRRFFLHEKRRAVRAEDRDAIARVIAGSRGPSVAIPASDRVESSIGRDGRVGSPIYRDR